MKYVIPVFFGVLLIYSCAESPDSDGVSEGMEATGETWSMAQETGTWEPLFSGESLDQYEVKNGQHRFELENGTIVGTTVEGEPNGFLCTNDEYADFILEFETNVDSLLNSGVQFRSHSTADYRDYRVHGYQVEIDAVPPIQSGAIYDEARRATWLANLDDNPEAQAAWKHGDWNSYRVEAIGDTLRTWVNGVPAVSVTDTMDASGMICLQVHQTDHPEPLSVRWRILRIMELE